MTDQPQTAIRIWRARPYRLNFYGQDDRLALTIPLTDEQAAIIGEKCLPPINCDEHHVLGEIALNDIVYMEIAS